MSFYQLKAAVAGLGLLLSFANTGAGAPANDQFASAQILSGAAAITAGSNVNATKEPGEPNHAGDPGGRSVWYRWTAPSSGTWAVDTIGSDFDTTLAIYTGNAVNSLALASSNDDARFNDGTSRIIFNASANVTYQIAVDGFGGASGNIVLKLFPTLAPEVIYQTGFETPEFSTSFSLHGQDGWRTSGTGENGIDVGIFPGFGQQAYLGHSTSFGADTLTVWRPLNFIPDTSSRPVVRFSVLMAVAPSPNGNNDSFEWFVGNRSLRLLFGLDFDNSNNNVFYNLLDDTGFHPTGVTFLNNRIYLLNISMDFARNRWSATLDGDILTTELPIAGPSKVLDLDLIEAEWVRASAQNPGDNFMAFDNYVITAEPTEVPTIVLALQNQSVGAGATASFAVVASGGEPLRYQWFFNNSELLGQTSPILTLANVNPGQAGNYSVTVGNVIQTVSSSATLTVNRPSFTAFGRLPNGQFQLTLTGAAGTSVAIEFSPDLSNWQTLTTGLLTGGSLTVSDSVAGSKQDRQFYRARILP